MAFDKKDKQQNQSFARYEGDYRLRRIPLSQLTDGSELGCLAFETKRKSIPLALIKLTVDAGECNTIPLKCAMTPFTQWHFESR